MKRATLILLAAFFAIVTWLQHRLIVNSILSFVSWCGITLSKPGSFEAFWFPSLVEYWIAGVVWVATIAWITFSLLKRRPGSSSRLLKGWISGDVQRSQQWATILLITAVYVALVAPFLAPVGPNIQGNLVTARLLPPLSIGYANESVDEQRVGAAANYLERVFVRANNYLLNRSVEVVTSSEAGSTFFFLLGTDENARDEHNGYRAQPRN
ncbi:MAG: hypothetical protein AAB393_06370, partial [Bacteroidota bacterium]